MDTLRFFLVKLFASCKNGGLSLVTVQDAIMNKRETEHKSVSLCI